MKNMVCHELGRAILRLAACELTLELFSDHEPAMALWPNKLVHGCAFTASYIEIGRVYADSAIGQALEAAKNVLRLSDVYKDMSNVALRVEGSKFVDDYLTGRQV